MIDADVPWIPNEQQPQRGLPASSRSARIRRSALSDAELPERPRHHLEHRERARGAGAGAGQAFDPGGAHRRAPHPRRRVQPQAQRSAGQGLGHADRRQDHHGLSQPHDRRDGRRRRRDLQRIFDGCRSTARARSRTRSTASPPPAGSAGASARRSAPSSPRPTSSWSRRSATAPTCSPTRWSRIGCRTCTSCRSSPSSSTTAATARCAAPPCRCSRTASPAQDDGRFMADLDPSPAFEAAVKAQGGHGERVEKAGGPAGGAGPRARDVVRQREAPGAGQRDLPVLSVRSGHALAADPMNPAAPTNPRQIGRCFKQTRRPWEDKRHDDADRRLHPFHSEPVLQGGDVGRLPHGHRQAHDGRAGDLRRQRPQEGGRQVQGLRADPVLPDAAVRADDQGPASRPRNTPRSSTTASPSSAPRSPTISPAGWRRRRWRRPTSACARPRAP